MFFSSNFSQSNPWARHGHNAIRSKGVPHYNLKDFFGGSFRPKNLFTDEIYKKYLEGKNFHFPPKSLLDPPKKLDWRKPFEGLEKLENFHGKNFIEIQNIPQNFTPEFMQEKLERFLSKFGPVKTLRCVPHRLDPFQCSGRGFVSFEDQKSVKKVLEGAKLKMSEEMGGQILIFSHFKSEKKLTTSWHDEKVSFFSKLPRIFEMILFLVRERQSVSMENLKILISEKFGPEIAEKIDAKLLEETRVFFLKGKKIFAWKISRATALFRFKSFFDHREKLFKKEFTKNWREDRPPLPKHTKRNAALWEDKKAERLPFFIQDMSRNFLYQRIFDDRLIFKRKLEKAKKLKAKVEKFIEQKKRKQLRGGGVE